MKIGILSLVNIKHMSLISHYTEILENREIEYDIIYVDKYNEKEHINAKNKFAFKLDIDNDNFLVKFMKYRRFAKYAANIIDREKYDLLIIWRTETALMMYDYLKFKFNGKYILNIRDYCFEKNKIVFNMVKELAEKSMLNTISSKGFLSFLPESDYTMVHSYNKSLLEHVEPKQHLAKKPIMITFIGSVRFYENDKKLLNTFANDTRFLIQYFGVGANELKKYCEDNQIHNAKFHDRFELKDTPKFLAQTDIVNNLYGKNDIALDTAISTKYYYGIYMNTPILVFEDTYMDEVTRDYGSGFPIKDLSTDLPDHIYDWYTSLDFNRLKRVNKIKLQSIEKENQVFREKIIKILVKEGQRI